MPRIPLLRQPGPIANAPAAVLDNQRRPNVDNRSVSQAVGNLADASRIRDVDPRDFTAPLEALGAVGEAVSKAGSVLGGLAIKRREALTDVQRMEADTALREAYGKHEAWREANPDPSGWQANLQETLASARQRIEANKNLTPAAREKIRADSERFARLSTVNVEKAATSRVFDMAKSGYLAKYQEAVTRKDYAAADGYLGEAQGKGFLWEHEVAGKRDDIARMKEMDAREAEREEYRQKAKVFDSAQNAAVGMAANLGEAAALKDLEAGKFGSFEPVEKERIRNSIQAVARDRAAVEADDLIAGIIGNVLYTDAHIDAWESPHLTPIIRQKAKDYLASRDAQAEAKEREVNGVRNAVEMRARVKEYDPTTDPDRTKYFELVKEIGSRVEQSMTGEITGELYRRYGSEPPKVTVRPEIQQNVSKSLDVTFDPYTGAVPWKKKTKDAEGKEITVEDPAARQRAIDAQTVVEMKMADWYKMHPDKANDLTEVSQAMRDFLPDGTRKGALSTLKNLMTPKVNPEPPNLGAQGEEGPDGVAFIPAPAASRVTSYAYQNDETPDSNSSAGIGAFVPDEEQAKIKRGEASPYRLREGDFAVSRDVERALRRAGIRPGDAVAVQMADGSTHTGRWMDRTAETWNGKTVTGRWDFYRAGKTTKHEKEAMKVTGFRRS